MLPSNNQGRQGDSVYPMTCTRGHALPLSPLQLDRSRYCSVLGDPAGDSFQIPEIMLVFRQSIRALILMIEI